MQLGRIPLVGGLFVGFALIAPGIAPAQNAASPIQAGLRPRPGDVRLTAPAEAFEAAVRLTAGETDSWRCQLFASVVPSAAGWLPHVGISNQWSLGFTPWGPLSASVDLHVASVSGQAWLALYWYPSEQVFVSVQFDCVGLQPRFHFEYVRD